MIVLSSGTIITTPRRVTSPLWNRTEEGIVLNKLVKMNVITTVDHDCAH